jgi:hypothetical protein
MAYTDTLENRKQAILANAARLAGSFLQLAKDKKSYICPNCGRGGAKSKHHDGLSIDFTKGGLYNCYSSDCGISGKNIIDLYCEAKGKEFQEAMDDLEAMLGKAPAQAPMPKKEKMPPEECIAQFEKLSFIQMPKAWRGIDAEVYRKYGAFYCHKFKNPKHAGTYHGARAAVCFPTSGGNYFVRAVVDMPIGDEEGHERCNRWIIGEAGVFNAEALTTSDRPIFVSEACIDALSFLSAGFIAVGLTGAGNYGPLVDLLKHTKPKARLLLAFDNDDAGRKKQAKLYAELQDLGIECESVDTSRLFSGAGDANEAIQRDKAGLITMMQEAEKTHKAELVNPWAGGIQSLIEKVQGETYKPTPTGIENLDKLLGGGFTNQQLIGITGRPGAGKTAFCQFLMESMALNREDFSAVYLCFEMSKEQLQARSISRVLWQVGADLAPIEILQGKAGWIEGANYYNTQYADKVVYMGVGGGLNSSDIEEVERVIGECIRYNASIGRPTPYICVDYLQIVSVKGRNEFEAIGEIMARLKGIAVKYNTVVLLVIANNRDSNKKAENDMFSGRGSGSIEYGADVLLSLNPEALEEGEKKENTRVSVKVAKGRWIEPNAEAYFEFNGKHMSYKPVNAVGRILSTKEAKVARDLINQPDRRGEVENIPLNI